MATFLRENLALALRLSFIIIMLYYANPNVNEYWGVSGLVFVELAHD